jgi:tight adherence protein B
VKRVALIASLVVTAFACSAAAASASSKVGVVEVKGPAFPVKTYTLSLPTRIPLTANAVTVTENGRPVVGTTLLPAGQASRKTFGVVLVLDTSYSMKGKPLAAAIAAEEAFVAQRNPNEQLALIEFNHEVQPTLRLTTSASKISEALAHRPKIDTGTHIYDAVAQAETMLAAAHIGSGSIVLLSDGADHGSTKTRQQVTSALTRHTKIYTIGLKDSSYKASTLKALAAAGHGVYKEADTQKLASLFNELSRRLSNQYVLQYKSLAGPHVPVRVKVTIAGVGTGTSGYRTPALSVNKTTAAPYKPSIGSRIWSSAITMVVLALFVAAVIALLVIGILQPRRSNLPARMAEFISIRGLQRDKGPLPAEADPTEQKTPFKRLEETLEIADIEVEPETLIAGTFAVTALTFLLIYVGTGSPWWSLLALAVPYVAREWVIRTLARRRNRFAEQLPDALQVIASALRSGHSFAGALAVTVESASEPMKGEMQRVVADEQLGIPIQNSLGIVAERMASRDIEQLALVAQLQREAGGDAAEVVDRVAETVRERFDLKRLIQTLTMQGRMSRWIVSALPIVVVFAVALENHHYFHPLTSTTGGRVVLGFAAAWAIAGSFVIKHIVEIEV